MSPARPPAHLPRPADPAPLRLLHTLHHPAHRCAASAAPTRPPPRRAAPQTPVPRRPAPSTHTPSPTVFLASPGNLPKLRPPPSHLLRISASASHYTVRLTNAPPASPPLSDAHPRHTPPPGGPRPRSGTPLPSAPRPPLFPLVAPVCPAPKHPPPPARRLRAPLAAHAHTARPRPRRTPWNSLPDPATPPVPTHHVSSSHPPHRPLNFIALFPPSQLRLP